MEDEEYATSSPYKFAYGVDDKNGTEFSQKVESDGEVITGEYRVLLPDGRLQIVTYTADWKNGFRPKYRYEGKIRPWVPPPRRVTPAPAPARTTKRPGVDENEEDIQPGGFTPKPTQAPCPPGTTRSITNPRCRPIKDEKARCIAEKKDPKLCFPELCFPGSKHPKCMKRPDENEEDIQPGGFTPKPEVSCPPGMRRSLQNPRLCRPVKDEKARCIAEKKDPKLCFPELCFPGSKHSKCLKRPDENEEDIQPGGFTPKPSTTPTPICPPGSLKAKMDPRCRCGLYSKDPSCAKGPRPDENEEDIQPGGFTPKPTPPPPKKPGNLYNAPDVPFGVRLNRKFGY